MPFIELAAAALLAQAAAAPSPPPAAGQPPIHVEAPEAAWDLAAGEVRLGGGALLRRGTLTLRAPSARYRPATGGVELDEGALVVDGARAVVAKALRGEVGGAYEVEEPRVFFVEDAAALARAATPEEALAARRRLTLRAAHATGSADGGIALDRASATLCACPGDRPPPWELRARRADVRPGERAILRWPVLWITPRFLFVERQVPVLAFPWLYVPLGERQTGLLLPELSRTASAGLTLVEPLFVTLGRSADATLWAGWAFGGDAVRGFVGALELRWAPAREASGQLRLDWVHDLEEEAGGTSGARVALRGRHAQRLGARGTLRAELDLVGDPRHVGDFTTDVLSRDATYKRSAVLAGAGGDGLELEAGAAWLLPVARDGSLAGVPGLSWGTFGSSLPTFHRGPALSAQLLPTPVGAGLLASGRVELARFGPASGVTSDGGADGIGPGDLGWSGDAADPGQLDEAWQPGERLAATRAAARAELSWPVPAGRWLRLAPFVRVAAAGYAFDAAADPVANAWAVAGATAETELSRRFGALRHAVVPRLAIRLGTGVAGDGLPAFAYDAWDRADAVPAAAAAPFAAPRLLSAAPPGAFRQGRASIETRLDGRSGALLRVELGQDLDLRDGALAETFATLRAAAGPLTLEGVARYAGHATRPATLAAGAVAPDDWTELRGSIRLVGRRGQELHASLRSVGAGGSPSEQGGVDALFDLRPTPLPLASQARAGFRLPLGPATIAYEVLFPGREVTVAPCDDGGTRRLGALHVQQQTASFTWDSPCRCFRLSAQVRTNDCGGLADLREASFGVALDLSPGEPLGALR